MVVGEIGFPREEFLYVLKWWEIKAIIDGYRKRERTFCVMTRWSTFMTMCTGMADMKKAGLHKPEDLLTFPWEKNKNMPTAEDIDLMQALLSGEKLPDDTDTE